MDLRDFFNFSEDSISLELKLTEFRTKSEIREKIWNSNLRSLRATLNDELLNMSWDLALEAVNTNNINKLDDALLLISIENFRIDYRDSIIRLALINYACGKLNVKLSEVLESVKKYSDSRSIEYYMRFLETTKAEKSLKAMGLTEIVKENVIYVEQIPPMWMKR